MKTLFAKLFRPVEKLLGLTMQYHMWQCGQHSTVTLVL